MSRKRKEKPFTLPVGTLVRVRFPGGTMDAKVIEDRGYLGIGGRQIVRIYATEETDFVKDFEMPAEELEVLAYPPGHNGSPHGPWKPADSPPVRSGIWQGFASVDDGFERRSGTVTSPRPRAKPLTLPVGTHVRVQFPGGTFEAEVIEDRGYLGIGGRQIVRIRPTHETDLASDFEVPSEEVEVVSYPPGHKAG